MLQCKRNILGTHCHEARPRTLTSFKHARRVHSDRPTPIRRILRPENVGVPLVEQLVVSVSHVLAWLSLHRRNHYWSVNALALHSVSLPNSRSSCKAELRLPTRRWLVPLPQPRPPKRPFEQGPFNDAAHQVLYSTLQNSVIFSPLSFWSIKLQPSHLTNSSFRRSVVRDNTIASD